MLTGVIEPTTWLPTRTSIGLAVIAGALGGLKGDVVRARVEVDGLTHAAVVLDVGDLVPAGGGGVVVGEGAVVGGHAGVPRELPAGAGGLDRIGVGRQDRCRKVAVGHCVLHRGKVHLVNKGRAAGVHGGQAQELDGVHSGSDREVRRLVSTVCRTGGRDVGDLRAVDQDRNLLVLVLVRAARWAAWNERL